MNNISVYLRTARGTAIAIKKGSLSFVTTPHPIPLALPVILCPHPAPLTLLLTTVTILHLTLPTSSYYTSPYHPSHYYLSPNPLTLLPPKPSTLAISPSLYYPHLTTTKPTITSYPSHPTFPNPITLTLLINLLPSLYIPHHTTLTLLPLTKYP